MVKSGEKPKKEAVEADASVTKKVKKDKKRKSTVAPEDLNGSAEPAPEVAAEEQPPSQKKQKKRKADEAPEAATPVPQEQLKKKKKKKDKEADQVDGVASPAAEPAGEAAGEAEEALEVEVHLLASEVLCTFANPETDALSALQGAPEAACVARPTSQHLIPIADPLADAKLTKKVLKLAKKASQRKQIKRGVKEVVKALRKKFKGCALAEATSPCWHAFLH